MTHPKDLSIELQSLLDTFAAAPGNVRALWHYAHLVTLPNQDPPARLEICRDGDQLQLIIWTAAERRHEIMRLPACLREPLEADVPL